MQMEPTARDARVTMGNENLLEPDGRTLHQPAYPGAAYPGAAHPGACTNPLTQEPLTQELLTQEVSRDYFAPDGLGAAYPGAVPFPPLTQIAGDNLVKFDLLRGQGEDRMEPGRTFLDAFLCWGGLSW